MWNVKQNRRSKYSVSFNIEPGSYSPNLRLKPRVSVNIGSLSDVVWNSGKETFLENLVFPSMHLHWIFEYWVLKECFCFRREATFHLHDHWTLPYAYLDFFHKMIKFEVTLFVIIPDRASGLKGCSTATSSKDWTRIVRSIWNRASKVNHVREIVTLTTERAGSIDRYSTMKEVRVCTPGTRH